MFYFKNYIMKKKSLLIGVLIGILNYMVAQDAVVANVGLNIIYQHVNNPIAVAIPNVSPDIVWVTAENAEIRKIDGVNYSILVTKNVRVVVLKIYKIVKNDTLLITSKPFKVLPITPYLKLNLFGKRLDNDFLVELPKAMLKHNNSLFINFDESFFFGVERKFQITKFDIAFGKEKNAFSTTVNGNKMPEDVINKILNDLGEGDEIKISNIEVDGIGLLSGIYTIKLK